MYFFENNQVQFWKYLVLNQAAPANTSPVARGYCHDNSTFIITKPTVHSVFFRCPALDYMASTNKGDGSGTASTTSTFAEQGYTKAWINSNRTKQNLGTTFQVGVIYTKTDDEDCYNYETTAYLTIEATICKSVSVTLYCGGENRLASLDDLNRIWMGMGTMDHHDCIDYAYSGLYTDRKSMMPTWDYYYDGWTSVSPQDDITTDDDDGKTSLYNSQGGYSGSVILTPKPIIGNMVLMKDIWVPIILNGGISGECGTTDGELIKCPYSTSDIEYHLWADYYMIIGDEEDILGVAQLADYRKTYKDFIFNIKITNPSGTVVCDTNFHSKAIQYPGMYVLKLGSDQDCKGTQGSSVISNYVLGKRFVECCIPKYVCGANYSGDSYFFKGAFTQEVSLYDPEGKYSVAEPYDIFRCDEGEDTLLNLLYHTSSTGVTSSWEYDVGDVVPYVYWPSTYGSVEYITTSVDSYENPLSFDVFQRYYGNFSGLTDSTTRYYIENIYLNNYQFTVQSTNKTTAKSISNTTQCADFRSDDFEMNVDRWIPYFTNVGLKVSGIYGNYIDSNSKSLYFNYGACRDAYEGTSYTGLPSSSTHNQIYEYTNVNRLVTQTSAARSTGYNLDALQFMITNIAV